MGGSERIDARGQAPEWPLPAAGARSGATSPMSSRAPQAGRPSVARRVFAGMLRVFLVAALLLIGASAYLGWRLERTVTNYAGPHFNSGANAIWLEHRWVGQAHSDDEYDQLAARLRQEQVRFIYAHVGPLDSDGAIPASRAPYASQLVEALRERLPDARILAWIGQVEAAAGGDPAQSIDLGNSQARRQVAQTAAQFVQGLGFDGVHYDIEPIVNNNPRFLDLLDETRAALPAGAILSVVGQKWAPNATVANALRRGGRADAWWTSYYYATVAAHVDQIVAMLYNTGMPTAQAYTLTVKQETTHILEAVRSAHNPPQVLIGLPTYAGNDLWFHDWAENVEAGLRGVTAGLNSNPDTTAFTGVALYRYGLTTQAEWASYDQLWLGR